MKNFKPLFFCYLLSLHLLYASDVAYSIQSSNNKPYLNQALVLEVNISQLDNSKVMLFNFSPKVSDAYDFHQIDFNEDEKYHDLKQQYTYFIYPKKTGKVMIEFDMLKSITDDDKVAYSISGDRDNVKGLFKEDIVVDLEPVVLEVQAPLEKVDLIGDFTLEYRIDKKETQAFEPVNLKVTLKGQGNLNTFEFLATNEAYTLFSQKPMFKALHSKEGTQSVIEWDYAILAKESFTISRKVLKAFNPETKQLYQLTLPALTIEVQELEETRLLDKEDSPAKSASIDWSAIGTFFSYLVVFLAGWLMPREKLRFKRKKEQTKEALFKEKVEHLKSHKELLELLLLENKKEFSEAIDALEAVVYNGKTKSLSEIQKMI